MEYKVPKPFEWNYCAICGTELTIAHDGQEDRPFCPDCHRFYYRNPIPAACCFVPRGRDELLFARRAVQPAYGQWTLPGGFVELGETTEECAIRELHEETNLRAERAKLFAVSTKQSPVSGAILVLGYHIDVWSGEERLQPASDALELQFFPRDAGPELAFSVHRELLAQYEALLLKGPPAARQGS